MDPLIWLFLLWFTFLGACIGSFSNVVVWRMPRGMSLSRPASHCPQCGHPIRWYHNIPILGWCVLRGRCADCHQPIPVFYPLVEGTVAMFFLCVMIWQIPAWNDAIQRTMPRESLDGVTEYGVATEYSLQTETIPPSKRSKTQTVDDALEYGAKHSSAHRSEGTSKQVANWWPLGRMAIKSVLFSLIPTLLLIVWLIHRDRQPIPRRLWFLLLLLLLSGVWSCQKFF